MIIFVLTWNCLTSAAVALKYGAGHRICFLWFFLRGIVDTSIIDCTGMQSEVKDNLTSLISLKRVNR